MQPKDTPTIESLANDLTLAGHDIDYLEIMVEDLMLLVSRLRDDCVKLRGYPEGPSHLKKKWAVETNTQAVPPRREGWAEKVYRQTVENKGQFSEHGDCGPMHPNDRLKNPRR